MIDSIVNAIVRPPRARYSTQDLGAYKFRHKGIEYHRNDFTVKNIREMTLRGSLWSLAHPEKGDSESCILYLHPNSGCRADVVKTRVMTIAAHSKCAVCGFDFAGCGESDGENISLGVNEKDDICAILSYLYELGYKKYILWGRSMGAATAVIFYGAYRELVQGTVVGLILDSPFTSMHGLANEYSVSRVGVPSLLVSPAVHYLRHTIQTTFQFDLYHMTPIGAAYRIDIPVVVLSGSEDKIVPPKLSEELYEALCGPKIRIFFQGGHNTHRPAPIYEAIRIVVAGILRGLPIIDTINMAMEVLKNQLIEFPQFQPLAPKQEISPEANQPSQQPSNSHPTRELDRRSSMDLPQEEAIRVAAESARALESLKMMSEITTDPEIDDSARPVHFTTVVGEVEKKLNSCLNEENGSNWSSITPQTSIKSIHTTVEPNHKLSSIKKQHSSHSKTENGIPHHSNHLLQQQHQRTKILQQQQQQQQAKESQPCVYSITVDYGSNDETDSEASPLPDISNSSSSYSWMGAMGTLFWPSVESDSKTSSSPMVKYGPYEGSPIGSYGYLMHQIGDSSMCPPDKTAWETLLISKVQEVTLDVVLDQIITLACGLIDSFGVDGNISELSHPLIPPDLPPDERILMMSMIVAQISSTSSLVSSVGGEETMIWGKLALTSMDDLTTMASQNRNIKKATSNNQSSSSSSSLEEAVTDRAIAVE